jgi:CheY-like chemotaxis protein
MKNNTLSSECLALIVENTYVLKSLSYSDKDIDILIVNTHTLTGNAQLMGLSLGVYISHAVEVALMAIKNEVLRPDQRFNLVLREGFELLEHIIMRDMGGATVCKLSKEADHCVSKILSALVVRVGLDFDFLLRFSKKYRDSRNVCRLSEKRSKNRILIADESTFYRKHISKYLISSGYLVDTFRCGESALNALTETNHGTYDCVVSEVNLSNISGHEMVRIWKEKRPDSTLKFLAIANSATCTDREKGDEAGFDRFLEKLNPIELIDTVDEMMGIRVQD